MGKRPRCSRAIFSGLKPAGLPATPGATQHWLLPIYLVDYGTTRGSDSSLYALCRPSAVCTPARVSGLVRSPDCDYWASARAESATKRYSLERPKRYYTSAMARRDAGPVLQPGPIRARSNGILLPRYWRIRRFGTAPGVRPTLARTSIESTIEHRADTAHWTVCSAILPEKPFCHFSDGDSTGGSTVFAGVSAISTSVAEK